jgi:hypothetical protein
MSLLARLTGLDSRIVGKRASLALGGFIAAVLLAGVAMSFLALALFAALSRPLGPAGAALLVALIAALVAALVFVWARGTWQTTRRVMSETVRTSTMVSLAPPLLQIAARRSRLLGALAVGVVMFMAMRRD